MKKTACILFLALLATSARASTDPFVGKGVRYRSDATYANGSKVHSEYTADYNGNQAIVMGAHGMMLPVFLKRLDPYTVVASYTKSLMVVATSRRVVSRDGHLMTITTTSKDASGKPITTIGVYEKQPQ
jgi:hypothetical protein